MRIKDLTPEQAEQLQACKTYEEFMALADEVGLGLDETQDKALRLLFDNPEAFVARMEQSFAEAEDADFTEDELKAVAGGMDERGYWAAIADAASGAAVRKQVMDTYFKYMNVM